MVKNSLLLIGLLVFSSEHVTAQTAGTVNGMKISVKEANQVLKQVSKNGMTWNKLPDEGKIQLIQMLAPSKLVEKASSRGLTRKEKESALANFWMQKKMSKTKISDKEAKRGYNRLKKMAKKLKSKKKLPTFKMAKNGIKMQLAQEKIVKQLLKKAKIRLK